MSTMELDLAPAPSIVPPVTTRMLVCASVPGRDTPHVSLADGVYETEHERVFWRDTPLNEVLRVPLDLPVSVRSTGRLPAQRTPRPSGGEAALIQAIRDARSRANATPAAPRQTSASCADHPPADQALARTLGSGDAELTYAHAVLLRRRLGLAGMYREFSRCLADLASSWAVGTGTVLSEHIATRTLERVTERLAASCLPAARPGTVVLSVPEGELHTGVLRVLAHLLMDAGRSVLVVDALPRPELLALAARPDTIGVLISVHTSLPDASLRGLLRDLRAAGPNLLLAVGGPGLPARAATTWGLDLLGDDLDAFLRALDGLDCGLSDREGQVLSAVADGLTNNEVADTLGLAPATVKSHMDKIFTKTGTEHRAAAVAAALRRGWIR